MTDICPVCTGLVTTIDGLLVEHRHRDQFGPCPAGQVRYTTCDRLANLADTDSFTGTLRHPGTRPADVPLDELAQHLRPLRSGRLRSRLEVVPVDRLDDEGPLRSLPGCGRHSLTVVVAYALTQRREGRVTHLRSQRHGAIVAGCERIAYAYCVRNTYAVEWSSQRTTQSRRSWRSGSELRVETTREGVSPVSMTANPPICITPIGTHASFTQPCGDHYSGLVTRWNGPIVTLSAYSQWVDGAITTYHSPHPDDTVSLYVTRETVVEVKPVEAVCRRCQGTFLAYGPSDGRCCLRACSDAPAVPAQRPVAA